MIDKMGNLAQNLHATVRCIQQFISEVNNMGLINCNDLTISCCSEIPETVASSYLVCLKELLNKLKVIIDGASHGHLQDGSSQDNSKRDLDSTSVGNPDVFLNNLGNICEEEANNQNYEASAMALSENGKLNSLQFGDAEKLDDPLRPFQTAEAPTIEPMNAYQGTMINSQTNAEYSHSNVLYSLSNLSIGSDKLATESRESSMQQVPLSHEASYNRDNETLCQDLNQTAALDQQTPPTCSENAAHEQRSEIDDKAESSCSKCGLSSFTTRRVGRDMNACTCSSSVKSRESKKKQHLSSITHHPCDKCNRVFRKWKHLSYHYHKVHKDEEASEMSFSLNASGPQIGHDLPIFCCKTCNVACSNLEGFQSHICRLSDEEENDSLTSINNKILITNVLKLHKMRKFICNICCIEYRTFKRILYHLPRCSPGPYSCNSCSHAFKSQRELNYHKRKSHKGEKCFTCDECGKGFLRAASLRKHSINRHESRCADGNGGSFVSFKCDLCPKTFIKKIYLTNHKLRMHGLDKKFLCQMCGKRFMSKNSLTVHMEAHKEAKRFECKFCQRKFRKKEKMQHHERIHTGERPFQCENCSKAFVSKGRLTEHQRRHKGEKRYCCPLCSKSYAAAWDLKKHTRKFHNKELESVPVKVIPSRDSSNLEDQQQPKHSEQAANTQPHVITLTSTVGALTIPIVHRVQGCQVSHLGHVVQLTGGPVLGHAINTTDTQLHALQTVQTLPAMQPTEYSLHTIQPAQGTQTLQPIQTLQALPNMAQAEYPVHTIQAPMSTDLYSSNPA